MRAALYLARLRRWAGGGARRQTDWSSHQRMAENGWMLVRVFYAVCLMQQYGAWSRTANAVMNLNADAAFWPIAWAAPLAGAAAAQAFMLFAFGVGLAVLAAPNLRTLRVFAALSALFHAALMNSWGGINHSWHEMVWIAALLCLLPTKGATGRDADIRTILVIASVGLMLLFFYSLSGAYKVWHATAALVQGEFGGFSPFAMAHTVARRAMETSVAPLFADLIVHNPWLGWPPYLAIYYIEFTAILVDFRPRLLPYWGLALIAFHLGTAAFLGIAFPQHIIWNALFLVLAPQIRPSGIGGVLADLPLFGRIIRSKS